ncbi:hypothetical protein [Halorussus litoreus]|nr:hypothetical protein [Halorussus litoreus]
MNWGDLFERAEDHRTDVATIRERLEARRDGERGTADSEEDPDDA